MWRERPFDRARALVDLILLANHHDGYIRIRGNKIEIKRGQVGYSMLALVERWGWSRGRVERFLNELEEEQQIAQQKNA
jgi:predicted transcriptional regulator